MQMHQASGGSHLRLACDLPSSPVFRLHIQIDLTGTPVSVSPVLVDGQTELASSTCRRRERKGATTTSSAEEWDLVEHLLELEENWSHEWNAFIERIRSICAGPACS